MLMQHKDKIKSNLHNPSCITELKVDLPEGKASSRKSEERILDALVSEGGLLSCSIVSKTGLLVASDSLSSQKRDTFAAMTAIVFSAAEACKSDVHDSRITSVLANFERHKLIIVPMGTNYVMVGIAEDGKYGERTLKSLEECIQRLKKEAPWLN